MDLGPYPDFLLNLTMIEQIFIVRVHPVVSIHNIRGQQCGYSGHVMNYVQHVESIATRTPHPISALSTIVLLNRDTPHGLIQCRVRASERSIELAQSR